MTELSVYLGYSKIDNLIDKINKSSIFERKRVFQIGIETFSQKSSEIQTLEMDKDGYPDHFEMDYLITSPDTGIKFINSILQMNINVIVLLNLPDYIAKTENKKYHLDSDISIFIKLADNVLIVEDMDFINNDLRKFALELVNENIESKSGEIRFEDSENETKIQTTKFESDDFYISKLKVEKNGFYSYLLQFLILSFSTLLSTLLYKQGTHDANIVLIYLLGVVAISLSTKGFILPAISAFVSTLLFNYLFVNPIMQFNFTDKDYLFTTMAMLFVSLSVSFLVQKTRSISYDKTRQSLISQMLLDSNVAFKKLLKKRMH